MTLPSRGGTLHSAMRLLILCLCHSREEDFSHLCGILQVKLSLKRCVRMTQACWTSVVIQSLSDASIWYSSPWSQHLQVRWWVKFLAVWKDSSLAWQKQPWPKMGYLECLNMSAAFPFTWKAKQCDGFVRDRVKSPLRGLCGLSGPGEEPCNWNSKKVPITDDTT